MTAHYSTASEAQIIAELRATVARQQAHIAELRASPLGILSGAAIRCDLRAWRGQADVIAVDWRKLHEWNEILGYDLATQFFAEFCRTRAANRRRDDHRSADIRGQWGGDEIVIAVAPGGGRGLLMRLIRALDELSAQLSAEQRAKIVAQTGGLIDQFSAVFVLIEGSSCPIVDAARAVAECGQLKSGGRQTGDRATSGRPGTIVATLPALEVAA